LLEIKVAKQGVSLWYFHVHMCYTPNWFISSKLSTFSTLAPFLWWFQPVSFLYSFLCREYSIFKFFVSFFYPIPPVYDLP
jgi:hypothetical protein